MFAARIPSKNLAVLARNLGTMLQAGVQLRRAIEVSSNKFRHPATKKALQEVVTQIQSGQDIAAALRSQGGFFPGLFIDMIAVAEETGAIPEVLLVESEVGEPTSVPAAGAMQSTEGVVGPACIDDFERCYEAILDHILRLIGCPRRSKSDPTGQFSVGANIHARQTHALQGSIRTLDLSLTCAVADTPLTRRGDPLRLEVTADAARGNRRIEEHSKGANHSFEAGPLRARLRHEGSSKSRRHQRCQEL